MKRLLTVMACMAVCHSLQLSLAFKLETGVPYFVRLRADRRCDSGNDFLGFYNRTCGSQPPRNVGPSLRTSSALTWRQWVLTIVGESDSEQWGYMETYYPKERGEARCTGSVNALDEQACRGTASEVATIDPNLGRSMLRFVPVDGEEGTYRIILMDRSTKGCNRFLSATADCSIDAVFFAKSDLGGLQRWVISKVDPANPSPTPPPTTSSPAPPTPPPTTSSPPTSSPPSPTPTPVVIPAPTLTSLDISFASTTLSISLPDGYPARSCVVSLSPGGHSEYVSMTDQSSSFTAFFVDLLPRTTYTATASCLLADGTESPLSKGLSFTTLGQAYNPTEGNEYCDGLGEVLVSGKCECDAEKGFVSREKGGCVCDGKKKLIEDGEAVCECDTLSGFIENEEGKCACDTVGGFKDDGDGGCECDSANNFEDDGFGGCKLGKKFYLAENGVTVLCTEAEVGDEEEVNGITYTKRTKDQITIENAATTCTSGITDMASLFSGFAYFNFNEDISHWDTSSVTTMDSMFNQASSFNQDISAWDTSSVTSMKSMFERTSFNKNIGGWNTGQVTDFSSMFFNAANFNQDIGGWDTSSAVNMDNMFRDVGSFNQDLSGWCVTNIPSEPSVFVTYNHQTFTAPKPVWGTCPQ